MLLLRSKEESSFLQKIEGFMLTLVCIGLASKAQAEKQANKQTRKQIITILDPWRQCSELFI